MPLVAFFILLSRVQLKRNPYYQVFCGLHEYQRKIDLSQFRIGAFSQKHLKKRVEKLFQMRVSLHNKLVLGAIVNSTIQ